MSQRHQDPHIPGRYLLQSLASGFLREDSADRLNAFLATKGKHLKDFEAAESQFPCHWISQFIPKDNAISPLILAHKFGDLVRLTSQGDLSLVLMTSPTIRESLSAIKYLGLHSNAIRVTFRETHSAGYVFIDVQSGSRFTDDVILYYCLAAIRRLMIIISGQTPDCTMHVNGEKPPAFDDLTQDIGGQWKFNQVAGCLVIDKPFLDLPSVFSDPIEHAAAIRACEGALHKADLARPLPDTIKEIMATESVWEQDKIAERLHISRSTLKRRLAQHGISFSALLSEARKQQAVQLLTASENSLQTIAERLGYTDQSNFSHAFKKWFNQSPREFMGGK